MRVLIDTSVWIDHFRNGNDALVDLIQRDLALTPPMVIVKIACGMLPAPRPPTLNNLGLLRPCHQASLYEVKAFIEREKLLSTLIAGPMLPPLHGDAGHPESEALRCRARQGACLLAHARRFRQLLGTVPICPYWGQPSLKPVCIGHPQS